MSYPSDDFQESIATFRGDHDSFVSSSKGSSKGARQPKRRASNHKKVKISSLDFERIVNDYSIKATHDRLFETTFTYDPSQPKFFGSTSTLSKTNLDGLNDESSSQSQGAGPQTTLLRIRPGYRSSYHSFHEALGNALPPSHSSPYHPPRLKGNNGGGGAVIRKRSKAWIGGYSGRKMTRWWLSVTTGLLTGLTAVVILTCTQGLVDIRQQWLNALQVRAKDLSWTYSLIFLAYSTWNLVLALASTLLSLRFATAAIGSGIPEIKAYLNGVRASKFTSLRLFLVKVFGTIFSVSSGLVIGPEGPLVHIGAIVGSSLTKTKQLESWIHQFQTSFPLTANVLGCAPLTTHNMNVTYTSHRESGSIDDKDDDTETTDALSAHTRTDTPQAPCFGFRNSLCSFLIHQLSHFRNDAERRDLVSIGAAAGFAAAFGAPIGGLLFSLEEASTFFALPMLLRTLVSTAIATFCIAINRGTLATYGIISLGGPVQDLSPSPLNYDLFRERCLELPLYAMVGALGGVLGALFNTLWRLLNRARLRRGGYSAIKKIGEVVVVSLLTSLWTFVLPLSFDWVCRPSHTHDTLYESSEKYRFNCEPGQINEMAEILFGSREDAITNIVMDPTSYDPRTLLIVGVLVYGLVILTFGISVPSGIFMPTMLTGASLGAYVGTLFQNYYLPDVSVPLISLLGAAAMLAGIQRSTVSLCVILMEGTGQTGILIPVIVTIVTARFVGDLLSHGLYEIAMELKEFPYLDHHVKTEYDIYAVSDIMSSPPVTIHPIETADTIQQLLNNYTHHGFPVVEESTNKFLGLVRRDQLVALLECGFFIDPSSPSPLSSSNPTILPLSTSVHGFTLDNQYSSVMENNDDDDNNHNHNNMNDEDIESSLLNRNRNTHHNHPSNRSSPTRLANRHRQLEYEGVNGDDAWIVDNVMVKDGVVTLSADQTLPTTSIPLKSLQTVVHTDSEGNLRVRVAKKDQSRHLDIARVMNRGTKCVTEQCPLSNAYIMFTTLGLRHLCVLGGESGGEVVGVVTRRNLKEEYIEERTRSHFGM